MGTRRRGREISLQILYKIDITGIAPALAQETYKSNFDVSRDAWAFAKDLTSGIHEHLKEIDSIIEGQSEHWRLDRMSLTDRNILRMAVYELLYMENIPSRVTINEAIELGKRYGSEESGAFINGILDKIYKTAESSGKKGTD